MTENAPNLRVDFNRMDDDDVIWAFEDRASVPADMLVDGFALELYDFDGNACLGYVVGRERDLVYVRPEWETWIDANPVSVTQNAATSGGLAWA